MIKPAATLGFGGGFMEGHPPFAKKKKKKKSGQLKLRLRAFQ